VKSFATRGILRGSSRRRKLHCTRPRSL